MATTELFKSFAETLFSSFRFYEATTGWSVFDIWNTFREDLIETVANEADKDIDDIEIKIFTKVIDRYFYKE